MLVRESSNEQRIVLSNNSGILCLSWLSQYEIGCLRWIRTHQCRAFPAANVKKIFSTAYTSQGPPRLSTHAQPCHRPRVARIGFHFFMYLQGLWRWRAICYDNLRTQFKMVLGIFLGLGRSKHLVTKNQSTTYILMILRFFLPRISRNVLWWCNTVIWVHRFWRLDSWLLIFEPLECPTLVHCQAMISSTGSMIPNNEYIEH